MAAFALVVDMTMRGQVLRRCHLCHPVTAGFLRLGFDTAEVTHIERDRQHSWKPRKNRLCMMPAQETTSIATGRLQEDALRGVWNTHNEQAVGQIIQSADSTTHRLPLATRTTTGQRRLSDYYTKRF
eukprot:3305169-Amphidinium_carterae.1